MAIALHPYYDEDRSNSETHLRLPHRPEADKHRKSGIGPSACQSLLDSGFGVSHADVKLVGESTLRRGEQGAWQTGSALFLPQKARPTEKTSIRESINLVQVYHQGYQ